MSAPAAATTSTSVSRHVQVDDDQAEYTENDVFWSVIIPFIIFTKHTQGGAKPKNKTSFRHNFMKNIGQFSKCFRHFVNI